MTILKTELDVNNIVLLNYIRSYNTNDITAIMKGLIIFIFAFVIKPFSCTDFDSYEVNRIEFTPLHDAIIFNDIADIMTEFENNMYSELNTPITNYSESDENIEDLLSEYQHYLDKAHKKRINYMEKTKSKNQVPLLRHEKYIKSKPNSQTNDQMSYYFNGMKHYPTPFFKAFETKYLLKPDLSSKQNYETFKPTYKEKALIDLPPAMAKGNYEPILSSCHCKVNQIPCKCPCKQCIITVDSESVGDINNQDAKTNNLSNDKLSVRIKVDVQLPNLPELMNFLKWHNNDKVDLDRMMSKEFQSTVNLPLPYTNFPMPLNMFDINNSFLKGGSPLHKITIHKKKKSRFNNNNKKHKNKKPTFHHDNLDTMINNTEQNNINLDTNKNITVYNNETKKNKIQPNNTVILETFPSVESNKSKVDVPNNVNKSVDTIYVTVNISNNEDNTTDEIVKENSIEGDYEKDITTGQPIRLKREIIELSVLPIKTINKTNVTKEAQSSNPAVSHRSDKTILAGDADLLHWPIECHNLSVSSPSKNITVMIMEREANKRKLNMTTEAIRSNRTKALEKAIFGDVNWDDVDTVAPVFMSFVGKYITGVLTFCSESVCHSMKCSDKVCTHRICLPQNRFNQNGHCSGNNITDSVANMESIMDLPSIIAFEIVDILQDNMAGKMYGKMTLCINSKCCTFVACKKHFQKSKCTFKDVDVSGHCPNVKNAKMK